MTELNTLEDILIARGEPAADIDKWADCPECGRTARPFALISVVDDPAFTSDFVCSPCFLAVSTTPAASPVSPWDSEHGAALKGQRNVELDRWRWTVMPDSPLSAPCKAAWLDPLRTLHRMTVDCTDPALWSWPVVPALEYPLEGA